jgi:hypothetical protein
MKGSTHSCHLEWCESFVPSSQETNEVSDPPSLESCEYPLKSHVSASPSKTELFEEEIRVKPQDCYSTRTSLEGIVTQLWKDYPGRSPSKATVWRMVQEGRKAKTICGSQLHIYSHSALMSYWNLCELKLFLEEKNNSWTKSYLLMSLGSKAMLS